MKKMSKKSMLIGTFCIIMASVLVSSASATPYCYGWYHLQNRVSGVYSSVMETSAVHHQAGSSMQKWDAIAVASGTNNYTAEVNLTWYQTDSTSTLFFTGARQANGQWVLPDLTTTISISNLDSSQIKICTGRNGNSSTVWLFRYSLDGGTNWYNIGSGTYDYGVVWYGDRYVTTFEDIVGGMTASTSPSTAGTTSLIQYQDWGNMWHDASLDTILNSGQDPHITYTHSATSETGTWHS